MGNHYVAAAATASAAATAVVSFLLRLCNVIFINEFIKHLLIM